MTNTELAILVCLAFMGCFNLGLTLLNFKLYTEFAKQRMQESRSSICPSGAQEETGEGGMSHQAEFPFIPPSTVRNAMQAPIARRTDSGTSHLAAAEMTVSGRREGQLLVVLTLIRKHPGKTSAELAAKAELAGIPFDRYVLARRLPELEKGGLVVKRNSRKCSVSGRESHTWEAL